MAHDLICLALPTWEGSYTKSTVQLMQELARRHRVLYVDYAYTAKDLLSGLMGRAPAVPVRRMLGLSSRLREVTVPNGARLWVLTPPPVLPANGLRSGQWYDRVQSVNARWLAGYIRAAAAQLGFEKPIVVNALNPFFGPALVNRLGERHRVYYCYDEIAASLWAPDHGTRLESRYLRQVSATVVSSEGLYRTKAPRTRRCVRIENGVDFETFATGLVPAAHKNFLTPTMGYLGTLDNRIDFELLETLARQLPTVRLLLVGRVSADQVGVAEALERLDPLPNVTRLGPQPAATLPERLREMHVGLIPFVKNEQTAAIYPMKINEYLAAGLPVVSTDFAPLGPLDAFVSTATNAFAFLRAVEAALGPDTEAAQRRRQEAARENSWAHRAAAFEQVLDSLVTPALIHA
jgi:glycosyltransferase involved in cell wall biosynthesis